MSERTIILTLEEAKLVEMLLGRWCGESFLFDDTEYRSIINQAKRLQTRLRLVLEGQCESL